MSPPGELKSALSELAKSLGFAVCRVAASGAPPHAGKFEEWLAKGFHGEMAWMAANKERRTDPQKVLPGARSVIVLGMNYFQGGNHPGGGKIARYAWGDDYHDLIESRLRQMAAFLSRHGGSQKCYVDTGPILERDFAALSGAGWHGKSAMLIHPQLGAWFFLAEILTTLSLPEDAPMPDRCGTCSRCITACPTGAIVSPGNVDARLCVSYLTIELKGSIPLEMRPLIGDRIYGCDDCLAACPWNRFATTSSEASFQARSSISGMALRDYLSIDEVQFRVLFRRSPIKRIKRRGLLRNVCVALGNVGTPDDLPALQTAAADPDPLVAEHAAWAIDSIRKRSHQPPVASAGPALNQ